MRELVARAFKEPPPPSHLSHPVPPILAARSPQTDPPAGSHQPNAAGDQDHYAMAFPAAPRERVRVDGQVRELAGECAAARISPAA